MFGDAGLVGQVKGNFRELSKQKKTNKKKTQKNIEVRGDMISPASLQVHFRTMYLLSYYLFQIQLKEAKFRTGLSLELST